MEWALAHLLKVGDSDLIPVPFEYQAIKADWPRIKKELESLDLSAPATAAQDHFMVPKPEGAFRVAIRLDPVDALVYTAAVYECAEKVEKARVSARVACSYRVGVDPSGRLFGIDDHWSIWTKRSLELARMKRTAYVVTADISDCYSQLGHHRVCNALENAGVSTTRAQTIEKMLGGWSALQSRGVPVGPHASILLAEACLNDVDQHLMALGYRHLRYVDDFRIFCRSRAESIRAIHDLTSYLFTAHRLALQPQKTKTYRSDVFRARVVESPEALERQKKAEHLKAIIEQWEALGYGLEEKDVDAPEINTDVIAELFRECLRAKPIRAGLLRYVYRRASVLRTNRIQQGTLKNLDRLVPILRDVFRYLDKTSQARSQKRIVDAVLRFATGSDFSFLPYVQEWTVDVLTKGFSGTVTGGRLLRYIQKMKLVVGVRGEALIARSRGDISWVRGHKERWQSLGPWQRRAVIYAGSVLKTDERSAWKKVILRAGDSLDRAVAIYALA
ncbi:MAG TPA: RNA-directed DNA polymerase [Polyangia bacterium]|nr:RNA-directed DNA polymerase [Polyangia bacterium]